jgi:hypothetical protein
MDGASLRPRRCTGLDLIKASLSLAMGLTTILTTIWVCPPNPPECEIPIFRVRTSGSIRSALRKSDV